VISDDDYNSKNEILNTYYLILLGFSLKEFINKNKIFVTVMNFSYFKCHWKKKKKKKNSKCVKRKRKIYYMSYYYDINAAI